MGRAGGEKTRERILATAEKLFSDKGYDGTGVQDIATAAGVNKALIYYHFKNKRDLIQSLFQETLDEMFALQDGVNETAQGKSQEDDVEKKIADIIAFLEKKQRILSVMLMEGLKLDTDGYLSLFQCAKLIIDKNINESVHKYGPRGPQGMPRDELLMHEFFTGFLPIVFFALFKDKWADFFECDRRDALRLFLKVFSRSHIQHLDG